MLHRYSITLRGQQVSTVFGGGTYYLESEDIWNFTESIRSATKVGGEYFVLGLWINIDIKTPVHSSCQLSFIAKLAGVGL